jgi:hypothetical protein
MLVTPSASTLIKDKSLGITEESQQVDGQKHSLESSKMVKISAPKKAVLDVLNVVG